MSHVHTHLKKAGWKCEHLYGCRHDRRKHKDECASYLKNVCQRYLKSTKKVKLKQKKEKKRKPARMDVPLVHTSWKSW